jgi:hypothetical protein
VKARAYRFIIKQFPVCQGSLRCRLNLFRKVEDAGLEQEGQEILASAGWGKIHQLYIINIDGYI